MVIHGPVGATRWQHTDHDVFLLKNDHEGVGYCAIDGASPAMVASSAA